MQYSGQLHHKMILSQVRFINSQEIHWTSSKIHNVHELRMYTVCRVAVRSLSYQLSYLRLSVVRLRGAHAAAAGEQHESKSNGARLALGLFRHYSLETTRD